MRKKCLATLLSLAMVLSLLPTWAIAVGEDIEVKSYDELVSALETAQDGGTIKLTDDVVLSATVEITKNLTIDMNGHNITGGENSIRALWIKSGTVEITGSGTISAKGTSTSSSVIRVGEGGDYVAAQGSDTVAGIVVGEDVTVSSDNCFGISIFGANTNETAVINGTISAPSPIGTNGYDVYTAPVVTLGAGATVTAVNGDQYALYLPSAGTYTIDGTINGGIAVKGGIATVEIDSNAVVTANEGTAGIQAKYATSGYGNGAATENYALVIENHSGYAGSAGIIVNGGTFNGVVGIVDDPAKPITDNDKKGTISISGGTFSDFSALDYLAEGADVTIKLQDNVTVEEQITIDSGKNIALDLNGKTISTGTANNLFLIDGAKVELTGTGTIDLKGRYSKTTTCHYGIQLKGSATDVANYSVLEVGKNVTILGDDTYGVQALKANAADQNSFGIVVNVAGRIEAAYGMTVNGYFKDTTGNVPKITVEKDAYCNGIYAAGYGVYDVYGTVESTDYGFAIKSGKLNVYDGAYIHCTGDDVAPAEPFGNGINASGAALQIEGTAGYAANIEINITGGKIESDKGVAVYGYGKAFATAIKSLSISDGEIKTGSQNSKYTSDFSGSFDQTGFISGGTFSKQPDATYLATGYEATLKEGKFVVAKAKPVQVDTTLPDTFNDLSDAQKAQITNNPAMAEEIETGIDEQITSADKETLKSSLTTNLGEAAKVAVEQAVDANAFVSYVKVTPKKAEEAELTNGVKLTFDVTPMLKVTAGGTTVETVLKPNMLATGTTTFGKEVTFRLPLTDNFTGDAKITHYNDDGVTADKTFYAQVKDSSPEEDGGKYVEISADHFSLFGAEPLEEDNPVVVEVNGETYLQSQFIDAVKAAMDDDYTMILLADVDFQSVEVEENEQMVPKYVILTEDVNVDRVTKAAEGEKFAFNVRHPDDDFHFVFVNETTDVSASAVIKNEQDSYKLGDPITVDIVLEPDKTYAGAYVDVEFVANYVSVTGTPDLTDDGNWKLEDGVYRFYDVDGTANGGVLGTFTLTAANPTDADGDVIAKIIAAQVVDSVEDAYSSVNMVEVDMNNATATINGKLHWADSQPTVSDKTYDGEAWNDYTATVKEDVSCTVTAQYKAENATEWTETAPTDAGTYEVKFTAMDNGGVYEAVTTEEPLTFTISPATLTVSFTKADDFVYDGRTKTLGSNPEVTGLVAKDSGISVTYTWEHEKESAQGTYIVKCTADAGGNYTKPVAEETVEIKYPTRHIVTKADYIPGYTMVYVFVEGDARVTYGTQKLYKITNLGYNYDATTEKLSRDTATAAGWQVYALLVKDAADADLVQWKPYNQGLVTTLLPLTDKNDVNGSKNVDLADAVAVVTAYNKNSTVMAKLNTFMATILCEDVNGDGKVDANDADVIKTAVTTIPTDPTSGDPTEEE